MSLSNKLLARFRMALPLVRNRAVHMSDAFCALLRRRRRLVVAADVLALPLAALLLWLAFAPCPHPLVGVEFSRMVLDKRGGIMRVSLSADQKYRIRTRLADIPPAAVDTVLRYEDRFFWHHPGINPLSLFRAAAGIVTGGRRMGGSTITMQVARLAYGLETGKMKAKLRQMLLALQLEWHYSKEEILEAYFNLAPYGGNVEGLGAAAVCYFHKTAAQLAPAESAALMLVPQNPSRRRPARDNKAFSQAVRRLNETWFGKKESAPLRVYSPQDMPFIAPHLSTELLQRPGADILRTTLDTTAQRRIERQLARFAARHSAYGLTNCAALLLHWPSMEVRALAGSADFFNKSIEGQVDGTRARRSPGSTLKPMIYALALEQGLIHPQSLLADTPHSFAGYDPENYDGAFRGPLSAAEALRASRNVPAITLAAKLTRPSLYEFLRRAGVEFADGADHYGLSLVLGGAEVSMRELAGLYAMLANKGVWRPLRFLSDEAPSAPALPLLTPEAAFVTLTMLEAPDPDKMARSQGGAVLPVRLKTGTSNGFRDAWAVGQFGPYVLAVWVGNFNNTANPLLVGGMVAAPLFMDMARELAAAEPMTDPFRDPAPSLNVEKLRVCVATGDLDTSLCPETTLTWFIPGVSPVAPSGVFRTILIDKASGLRACAPQDGRTEQRVWEFWPSDLARMFARAGMPKPPPPPFEEQCRREQKISGQPPTIIQPKSGLVYRRTADAQNGSMVFMAHAEAGVNELFWFANDSYVGSTAPGEPLLWQATTGDVSVRVVDDAGRAARRNIRVRPAP
ncbi:penicillin-binding protein 1C [Desulfovibrio desulfuricans]|uniref:penicillin-binding protein 1C n=1 Tax=Desulfovibrio desulfuricans TaxID=876 RepID=UPI00207975DB|nr:penicillin-binding protein 1C [Desulfovibrio desulfuricans]